MSAWQVLFGWPNGSTIGNFVDDAVMFILGVVVGRVGLRWLHKRLHAQAERHHRERGLHAEVLHAALVEHMTLTIRAHTTAPSHAGMCAAMNKHHRPCGHLAKVGSQFCPSHTTRMDASA